jgi:hypothetical protein
MPTVAITLWIGFDVRRVSQCSAAKSSKKASNASGGWLIALDALFVGEQIEAVKQCFPSSKVRFVSPWFALRRAAGAFENATISNPIVYAYLEWVSWGKFS